MKIITWISVLVFLIITATGGGPLIGAFLGVFVYGTLAGVASLLRYAGAR